MAQVVTQLIVDASGAKTGVAEFEAAMTRAKKSAVDAGDATASSFERAQSRWTASLAKTDPIIKAQIAMEKDLARQREINTSAVKLGITTQEAANTQLSKVAQQHQAYIATLGNAGTATKQFGTQTGLARHELINLGRQGADVFTQLASGQSLFLIAAQQGPQVLDVLATSQVKVGDAFKSALGWAGRFLTSTTGIVTGIGAIAVGAVYMASQFSRASTTIEEALETQNRLLKEGKALLDARTSTEARASLQSREQTQFETLQNQLDLQIKLNQAMEDAANISRRRATRPTEVPGEMGVAPTAFAALSDPGLDKMTAAFVALKEAQAAGLPGLKQYNAELAKIGLAHPELALIVQDMIKAGEAGLQLENAAQRAKAMSDALAGIATNAQMAAVGLGSVAQFQVNNAQAEQAAAATERQAVATMQLAQIYPNLSIEVAKQQAAHNAQLPVIQAITGAQQMAAQYAADYANALAMGKTQADALAIATMNIEKAQAAATASVEKQTEALKDQNAMLKARQSGTEASTAAAIAYKNAIAAGADETSAAALRAETLKNYMLQASSAAGSFASQIASAASAMNSVSTSLIQVGSGAGEVTTYVDHDNPGYTASFDVPKGTQYTSSYDPMQLFGALRPDMTRGTAGRIASDIDTAFGNGGIDAAIASLKSTKGATGYFGYGMDYVPGTPVDYNALMSQANVLYGLKNAQTTDRNVQLSNLNDQLSWLQTLPATIAREQAISSLQNSIDQLKKSTDGLNDTMGDALSPYYSQDPRTSKIGFRSQGMASGGEFTVPGGYSANDNMIGTIPLASGEIVSVRRPGENAGKTVINVTNNINVNGNVDQRTVNAIGRTAYQETQRAARNIRSA